MTIPVCFAIGCGLVAVAFMLTVAVTIQGDGTYSAAGQRAEVARLTAPLPPGYNSGRHHLNYAPGTTEQQHRWTRDTIAWSLADLGEVNR